MSFFSGYSLTSSLSSIRDQLGSAASRARDAAAAAAQEASDAVARFQDELDRALLPGPIPPTAVLRSQAIGPSSIKESDLVAMIEAVLEGPVVDLRKLRALTQSGISDKPDGLRSRAWRILLGYLPAETAKWEETLARRRIDYAKWVEEFMGPAASTDPGTEFRPVTDASAPSSSAPSPSPTPPIDPDLDDPLSVTSRGGSSNIQTLKVAGGDPLGPLGPGGGGGGGGATSRAAGGGAGSTSAAAAAAALSLERMQVNDHPLSNDRASSWARYFKESEVLAQIDKDVVRTHPDVPFFAGGDETGGREHRRQLRRALFVMAKLNGRVAYVQGMNELIAPLYYVLRSSAPSQSDANEAEADSLYCLSALIAEVRDCFTRELDNTQGGVKALLARLERAVRQIDAPLAAAVYDRNEVHPQYYGLRWFMTCLAGDFRLTEVLRLWDFIVSSEPGARLDALLRLCVALHIHPRIRTPLLIADFANTVKLLQNSHTLEIPLQEIVEIAKQLPEGLGLEGEGS